VVRVISHNAVFAKVGQDGPFVQYDSHTSNELGLSYRLSPMARALADRKIDESYFSRAAGDLNPLRWWETFVNLRVLKIVLAYNLGCNVSWILEQWRRTGRS
jgi:hypothetical protein